jgi:hypothetical protein
MAEADGSSQNNEVFCCGSGKARRARPQQMTRKRRGIKMEGRTEERRRVKK